jgi:hypothetical protein
MAFAMQLQAQYNMLYCRKQPANKQQVYTHQKGNKTFNECYCGFFAYCKATIRSFATNHHIDPAMASCWVRSS